MNIFFDISGCVLRELDLKRVKNYFSINGAETINNAESADIIVFSTCAVYKPTTDDCIKRLIKYNSFNKKLLVLGCLPSIMPEAMEENKIISYNLSPQTLEEIDKFFPNFSISYKNIELSFDNIEYRKNKFVINKDNLSVKKMFKLAIGKNFLKMFEMLKFQKAIANKKSAFYVISSGCNNHCSYCGIKKAVGSLKSLSIDKAIEHYKNIISSGNEHIIFFSDDTAAYGEDIGTNFAKLITELDSISPQNITWEFDFIHPKKLIEHYEPIHKLVKSGRIVSIECPTEHLSPKVLKRMNRNYDIITVIKLVNELKMTNNKIFLSSHHIVGFPGEDDLDQENAINILNMAKLDFVDLVAYYENDSCPAKKMFPKVDEETVRQRLLSLHKTLNKNQILHGLSANISLPFNQLNFKYIINKHALKDITT